MFNKLCRIGNEPVIRHTQAGDAVLGLSLAYSYGKKGTDGKKPTQWIDATIWGKQAEAVAPYFKKGDQISASLDDLHIETYEGKNGAGSKLVGRIVSFDFVGGKREGSETSSDPAEHHSGARDQKNPSYSDGKTVDKPAAKSGSFDDAFDDSIPF